VFTTVYFDDFAEQLSEISKEPPDKKLKQSLLPFTAVSANRGWLVTNFSIVANCYGFVSGLDETCTTCCGNACPKIRGLQ